MADHLFDKPAYLGFPSLGGVRHHPADPDVVVGEPRAAHFLKKIQNPFPLAAVGDQKRRIGPDVDAVGP